MQPGLVSLLAGSRALAFFSGWNLNLISFVKKNTSLLGRFLLSYRGGVFWPYSTKTCRNFRVLGGD